MYYNHPLNQFYRATITISDKNAQISLVLRSDFHHAANAVHGSVYWKLLDDSAFFAVNSVIEDVFVLTASFTIYLTKPISSGTVIAKGILVNATQSQFIAESVLYSDQEEEIARGSGVYIRSRMKFSPEMGYKI
jgi:uncharacterized protein (TIGR00369 family)